MLGQVNFTIYSINTLIHYILSYIDLYTYLKYIVYTHTFTIYECTKIIAIFFQI